MAEKDGDLEIVRAEEEVISLESLEKECQSEPVVKLVNQILANAVNSGASGIHIEPYKNSLRVRYRMDGALHQVLEPAREMKDAIVGRIKMMSELNLAERRLPQQGQLRIKIRDREIAMIVNSIPTIFGERMVMEILKKGDQAIELELGKLGFENKQLEQFRHAINQTCGLIIVAGPSGSGKNTTIYSALWELNRPELCIATAEWTDRWQLPGVNQTLIQWDIGLNFASATRTFLQTDADIIFVREVTDYETAEMVFRAALNNKLIFIALHTVDTASTIIRLVNMGIDPWLITSGVLLINAQRLLRKLCPECRKKIEIKEKVLVDAGLTLDEISSATIYQAKGCPSCHNTGYHGRVMACETLALSDDFKDVVLNGKSAPALKEIAIQKGMQSLRRSALKKMMDGLTSLEEVLRHTPPDPKPSCH